MTDEQIIDFQLNIPQARALMVMPVEMWLLWSRGTGKTVGAIAPWILHKVENMPRSNGGLIGKTFTDLEKKILQPIFSAFEMLGYKKDVHYVYGKRPPEGWESPLTPIIDYSQVVSFPNGTVMELISLNLKGSANGKSLQWIVADEAKLLDENQLRGEVFPILRGQRKVFGDSPWYGSKLFVTDKLAVNINWILAKKKLHDEELVNAIIYYQAKLNELKQQMGEVSSDHVYKIRRQINSINKILTPLRKQCVYYGEAKAMDNIENLGPDFFDNMKRSLTPYEYKIAIENEDPTKAENGFYAGRNDTHLYNGDQDDDIYQPLAVAIDYQASISPLVVAQLNDRVIPGITTLNFLKDFYVLYPLGMKHVIDNFCAHYQTRPCKQVYFFFDKSAVGERNMHKKFYEEVIDYFEDNGWQVTPIYMGNQPLHNIKYERINHFFQNTNEMPYQVRIHQYNCASMLLSMDLTGTKHDIRMGTKKDKSKETDKNYPQDMATHFGDTFDMLVWGINELNLYPAATASFISELGVR